MKSFFLGQSQYSREYFVKKRKKVSAVLAVARGNLKSLVGKHSRHYYPGTSLAVSELVVYF